MARKNFHLQNGVMLAGQIARNIARLREARGWSRPALAKRLKPPTSAQQIERLEKNSRRLTIEWVERLAEAFGIPAYQLIVEEDPAAAGAGISEPVAARVAATVARIALGHEPSDDLVSDLAEVLQEFAETFAAHPSTRSDPESVKPVADLLARRFSR